MKKLAWCLPGILAALCACSKKEAEAPPAAPPAPPAAEAPAAPAEKNAAERYVSGLQSSVEKAKGARDKANAAIERSTPAEQ